MLIEVSQRHGVDKQTDLGWRDFKIVCDIGTITGIMTDDGSHIDHVEFDPSDDVWNTLQESCRVR